MTNHTDDQLYYDPTDFDAECLVQLQDGNGNIEVPSCDDDYLRCLLRVFRDEGQPVINLFIDGQQVPMALGHRLATETVIAPEFDYYGEPLFDDCEGGADND